MFKTSALDWLVDYQITLRDLRTDIVKDDEFQVDFSSKPTLWRKLHPQIKVKKISYILLSNTISLNKESFQEKLGELLVSLSYYPANNTLTLGVLKVMLGRFSHQIRRYVPLYGTLYNYQIIVNSRKTKFNFKIAF